MKHPAAITRRNRFRKETRTLWVGFGQQSSRWGDLLIKLKQGGNLADSCDLLHAPEALESGDYELVVLRIRRPVDNAMVGLLESLHEHKRCALLAITDEGIELGAWTQVVEVLSSRASEAEVWGVLLNLLGEEVRMLSALHAAEVHALHRTLHDGLTGLANRERLLEAIDRSIAQAHEEGQGPFSLVLIDLDHFKLINESQGHSIGDQLLREVASRISSVVSPQDTVARLAADEFLVLLQDAQDSESAMKVASEIQDKLAERYFIAGRSVHLSASIGVALYQAEHQEALDVLRDASTAMHAAKGSGRGHQVLFGSELRKRAELLFDIENELPRAIEQQELCVFYQPILRLSDQSTVGCEALVRWQHPERGLISPFDFIAVAEATGLVVPLGQLVLNRACAAAQRWNSLLAPDQPRLRVSVNVSPVQFERSDVTAQVKLALERSGLAPELLAIEVTESLLIRNVENAISTLRGIRDLGVAIYLDDFGTGYSSLSYLVNLPLNVVKIDRAFVKDIETRTEFLKLTRGIVSLAHGLDLQLTAEGIEDENQQKQLRDLGVEFGQGYFYSRPLPEQEFERLLIPDRQILAA